MRRLSGERAGASQPVNDNLTPAARRSTAAAVIALYAVLAFLAGCLIASLIRAPAARAAADGWETARPEECATMKDAMWWAKEGLSKEGMHGPIRVLAGPDWTRWTRDGANFVFEVRWRSGTDCVESWRTIRKGDHG